ncbi:OsmC family protein [Hymenobacter chitinivorans]|uniref:Putative redox protein n=1 Tax=Hymenobacter chitinivorans DSM 11115 TaxID=1121954 RepID=A0A2M9BL34_9BACT|nr:OsmC family protein [Hymenobacter chitinivorans]PJJ58630.1 putative redox protein [Hymenobacter chitinivorans DSM 11115]
MPTLTGRSGPEPYLTRITSDTGHELLADEPLDKGGQNLGLTPGELLAASLSACVCITVRMYAQRKQWPLTGVEAQVTLERNEQQVVTRLGCALQLAGEQLTEEQRLRLLRVAELCPIHKTLMGAVPISTQLA